MICGKKTVCVMKIICIHFETQENFQINSYILLIAARLVHISLKWKKNILLLIAMKVFSFMYMYYLVKTWLSCTDIDVSLYLGIEMLENRYIKSVYIDLCMKCK